MPEADRVLEGQPSGFRMAAVDRPAVESENVTLFKAGPFARFGFGGGWGALGPDGGVWSAPQTLRFEEADLCLHGRARLRPVGRLVRARLA